MYLRQKHFMESEVNWILSCHFHRRLQICFSQEAKSKIQSFYFEHRKLAKRRHHVMKMVTQIQTIIVIRRSVWGLWCAKTIIGIVCVQSNTCFWRNRSFLVLQPSGNNFLTWKLFLPHKINRLQNPIFCSCFCLNQNIIEPVDKWFLLLRCQTLFGWLK